MEEQLKAAEDLKFIKKMISDRKNIVLDNGVSYIVWGLIIIAGLIYTYFDVITSVNLHNDYVWFGLIFCGWMFSFSRWKFNPRQGRVKTFASKILGMVWLASGISLTILGFVGTVTGAISGVFVSPILSVVLGIAFFVTAQLFNDSKGVALSTLWWVGAIVMFVYPGLYVLLLMAAMMFFLQVLPGILLFNKYRAEVSG